MIKHLFLTGLSSFIFFTSYSAAKARVVINEVSSLSSPDWVEIYFYEGGDPMRYQLKDNSTSGNINYLTEAICTENICVVDWSNRLNDGGDTIYLQLISSSEIVDQITYGGEGNVCIPEQGFSIGRVASLEMPYYPTNVWERFSTPSKGLTNNNGVLFPCPSPTPLPTSTFTPSSKPTSTPVPTFTPTLSPTPIPTKIPSPTNKDIDEEETSQVLGTEENGISDNKDDSQKQNSDFENEDKEFPLTAGIFILGGLGLIAFPIFNYLRNKKGL